MMKIAEELNFIEIVDRPTTKKNLDYITDEAKENIPLLHEYIFP